MTSTSDARRNGLRRALFIVVPLLLLVAFAPALQNRATAEPISEETIDFSHKKHIDAGVQCLFCHPGAFNGMVAGIPSVQKCVGCHQNIRVRSEEGQATVDTLMRFWEEERPLRWPKITDIPDFVYFSHRPHIAAGKNCENCHGDVGQMTMARPARRINMGFCLQNCHRHEEPEKRERLMDCATCHK